MTEHHKRLEQMYLSAPVQNLYTGISLKVGHGKATITLPVDNKFFHAGNSLHGSVYFRLLDDAAYFAVNSLITDVFLLTSSFQIDFLRPVTKGILRAEGMSVHSGNKLFLGKSDLYDDRDRLVATGKGTFMRSKISLNDIDSYAKIR